MPLPLIPLIPIIAALTAGGAIVPHAAGGFIVSGAAGYIAGTYLSTAGVAALLGMATVGAGITAAAVTGVAASVIGSAGVFGTTVGSSGIIGGLMSVGIISSVPVMVPVAIATAALGGAGAATYGSYKLYEMRKRIKSVELGKELTFSDKDAKFVQKLLQIQFKKDKKDGDAGLTP